MSNFTIIGELWQGSDYLSWRHEVQDVPDVPRLSTGEYPVKYPPHAVYEESRRLGLFSGFRIAADFYPSTARFDAACPETDLIQIDLLRSTTDFARPENQALGIPYEEFAERYFNAAFDYALRHPGRVMLCGVGEIDSSHPWPRNRYFSSRQEALDFFKEKAFHCRIGSCDPETLYAMLARRGLSFEQAGMMIHGACLFAIPYYFEWGFPYIEIERGLGGSLNMQVSLAYLRGAWKQYGRKAHWGIDFSTHQPNYNQCNWYDEEGRRVGGFSESLVFRCWVSSWFGGAEYLLCEGSDYTHWVFSRDGSFSLSDLGKAAQVFADLTLRSGIERGEPLAPAAVLLSYCNGYEQESGVHIMHPVVWGNCLPYNAQDLHIGNIFSEFFPGQEHISSRSEKVANPDCPYSTRQEYLAMQRNGVDLRSCEGGFLTPSPYGDSIEVLWDNAPMQVLREYPVLIPAGTAVLPENVLEEYVALGGTLAVSLCQLTGKMQEKLGIKSLSPLASDWDYDRISLVDNSFSSDGLRYGFARVEIPNARVLAVNSRKISLVYEVPFGQGKVLLCTVPYGQDISGSRLLGVWGNLIGREVLKHFPVAFDSRSGLEVAVNRINGGWLLALFNNTEKTWIGTLKMKAACGPDAFGTELYPVEEKRVLTAGSWNESVEPFSVKILRITE